MSEENKIDWFRKEDIRTIGTDSEGEWGVTSDHGTLPSDEDSCKRLIELYGLIPIKSLLGRDESIELETYINKDAIQALALRERRFVVVFSDGTGFHIDKESYELLSGILNSH